MSLFEAQLQLRYGAELLVFRFVNAYEILLSEVFNFEACVCRVRLGENSPDVLDYGLEIDSAHPSLSTPTCMFVKPCLSCLFPLRCDKALCNCLYCVI